MLCLSSAEFNISRQGFNDPQPPCGFTQGIFPLQASLQSAVPQPVLSPCFVACHICYGEVGWVVLNRLCFVSELLDCAFYCLCFLHSAYKLLIVFGQPKNRKKIPNIYLHGGIEIVFEVPMVLSVGGVSRT